MKKIRTRFERFCYQHASWGIPNLMLYICIGTAMVYLFCLVSQDYTLMNLLAFDRDLILQGQVWRLISHVFTYSFGSFFMTAIGLICFYSLGRAMEVRMGTLKFNLLYLGGILLQVIFAMIFGGSENCMMEAGGQLYYVNPYSNMVSYQHLILLIGYATLYPEAKFLVFFFIPIQAWILGVLYVALILLDVIGLSYPILFFPHNLFPLIPLLSYFLIFGSQCRNLLPLGWRSKTQRSFRAHQSTAAGRTNPFASAPSDRKQPAYNHRCTICGRTDISNPELSFRYCSKCVGYHCYCEDHISNHTHIED